jgi:hypothetical protein
MRNNLSLSRKLRTPIDHRSTAVVQKPYTTHNLAKAVDDLTA